MSIQTAHCAVAIAVLCASLAACSAIVAVQEPGRVFHPYVTDANPPFKVIDSRPAASRTSRQIDRGSGVSAWVYGDEQFSPKPVQVVADRFAKMFPAADSEDVLVITELEIYYELATIGEITGCGCAGPGPGFVMIPLCPWLVPACEAERKKRNIVNVRLSGSFNGSRFDVGHTTQFLGNASEMRVLTALQVVIDKALTEVAERHNAGRIGLPDTAHKANPQLP